MKQENGQLDENSSIVTLTMGTEDGGFSPTSHEGSIGDRGNRKKFEKTPKNSNECSTSIQTPDDHDEEIEVENSR